METHGVSGVQVRDDGEKRTDRAGWHGAGSTIRDPTPADGAREVLNDRLWEGRDVEERAGTSADTRLEGD